MTNTGSNSKVVEKIKQEPAKWVMYGFQALITLLLCLVCFIGGQIWSNQEKAIAAISSNVHEINTINNWISGTQSNRFTIQNAIEMRKEIFEYIDREMDEYPPDWLVEQVNENEAMLRMLTHKQGLENPERYMDD